MMVKGATLILVLCVSLELSAQGPGSGSTEVSVALGPIFPMEADPLNVSGELPMPTSVAINLGIRKYIGDMAAVGVRALGTINKLSDYLVTITNGGTPRTTEFSFTTYSAALECLVYLTSRKNVRPYLALLPAYSAGLLTNEDFGSLPYRGFTIGGSGGVRFALSDNIALALEAIGTYGSAKWRKPPFTNSSSDAYDPSTIMVFANIWFLID